MTLQEVVASYVEKDFNDTWFYNEEGIRSDSEKYTMQFPQAFLLLKRK